MVFEFDRFVLDLGTYELRRAGRKVRLQRVPMDLLILLVERNGALVTRDEIASRIWSEDPLVDTQSSINTAIRKIRDALGDHAEKSRFVETVVGKGYRFAGDISTRPKPEEAAIAPEPAGAIEPAGPIEAGAAVAPARQPIARLALAGVAGAVVIGAIAVIAPGLTPHITQPMTIHWRCLVCRRRLASSQRPAGDRFPRTSDNWNRQLLLQLLPISWQYPVGLSAGMRCV